MPNTGKVTIALLAVGQEQAAAQAELDGNESVRYCETADRLVALVEPGGVDVVIAQLRDSRGHATVETIASLHRSVPDVPLVGFVTMKPASLHDIQAALDAGLSEWSVRGYDRLGSIVSLALRRGWHPTAARPLAGVLRSVLPRDLHEFATACAIKASPRLTAGRIAEWTRTSERTLRSRLQREGLQPPSDFIEYGTAVHAAYLLDQLGQKVTEVATDMGFADRRALNRVLRRYTGESARNYRRHADLGMVLESAGRLLRRSARGDVATGGVTIEQIDRFLAGGLSPAQQVEMEKRLLSLPDLAEYVAELRRLLASEATPDEVKKHKHEVWTRLLRDIS